MATPLSGRNQLDRDGLRRLIEHLVNGGCSGLFILGTTGEAPSLSYSLRRELIAETCALVKGRVPVLVGITDTSLEEALAVAACAAESGADAAVAAPPFYLPASQAELGDYYLQLAAELPLPLMLYNMPELTKVNIEIETLRRLVDHPRIIGLKDSSGNMMYFHEAIGFLKQRPDWTLLMGPEELVFDAVLAGAHGGVSGGANVFPALYTALADGALRGDLEQSRALHAQVLRVSNSLYRVSRYSGRVIKGIKCALSCLGICSDRMAEPFKGFSAEERAMVQQQVNLLSQEIAAVLAQNGNGARSVAPRSNSLC